MGVMQIAGTNCGVCGSRIAAEDEGLGCAPCRATYHKSCLVPAARCRTCQADLELAAEDAEVQAQAQQRDELARGRLQVLAVIALVLFFPALQLVLVTVAFLHASDSPAVTPQAGVQALGVLALHVAIAAGLYYGSAGMARFVRIALGLACVLQGLAVWRDAANGLLPIAALRALGVVLLVLAFLLLTTSKSVDAFLQRRLLRDAR